MSHAKLPLVAVLAQLYFQNWMLTGFLARKSKRGSFFSQIEATEQSLDHNLKVLFLFYI